MNAWVEQIFRSKQARKGGIIRRKVTSVEHYASLRELKRSARRHGFMIFRNGEQYLLMGRRQFKVIMAR